MPPVSDSAAPSQPEAPSPAEPRAALEEALTAHEAELLDSARAWVYNLGFAERPARVKGLAREAFQNAAADALEKADEYDPPRPPRPWLRRFVFNAVRTLRKEHERRAKKTQAVQDAGASDQVSDEESTDEDLFAWLSEKAGRVNFREGENPRLIWIREHASEEDRAVLELRLRGYTGDDLAEKLGERLQDSFSYGAAAARLSRAKQRMTDAFRNQNA